MPGLMDFDEQKRKGLPRRSSLSAYLGGAEAAEAERPYQGLQAAFARPLGLPRRQRQNGTNGSPDCSCEGAACGCHEGASGKPRLTRQSQTEKGTRGRMTAHPVLGDVGGLLGKPPLTNEAGRLVASRQPTGLSYSYNHGLKDEGNFLSGHSVPSGADSYQPIAGQSCGAALRACQRARPDTDRAECFKAWLRCRNTGLPVIFAPGIWGQGGIGD
jgi:hypothetical protein